MVFSKKWSLTSSSQVPFLSQTLLFLIIGGEKGDLLEVKEGIIPCDILLVAGKAIVDEASLTGESL